MANHRVRAGGIRGAAAGLTDHANSYSNDARLGRVAIWRPVEVVTPATPREGVVDSTILRQIAGGEYSPVDAAEGEAQTGGLGAHCHDVASEDL